MLDAAVYVLSAMASKSAWMAGDAEVESRTTEFAAHINYSAHCKHLGVLADMQSQ